jgi:hypothetical protein
VLLLITALKCSNTPKRALRKASCTFSQLFQSTPSAFTKLFSTGSLLLAQSSKLSFPAMPWPRIICSVQITALHTSQVNNANVIAALGLVGGCS